MTQIKAILDKCRRSKNITGSPRTFSLYKSLFHGDEWKDFPFIASLQRAWVTQANSEGPLVNLNDDRESYGGDAVSNFINHVESGFIPPPEAMLAISDALQRYLACNGTLSLDESFFGVKHTKNTSYAMAKGANQLRMHAFSIEVSLEQHKDRNKSQVQIAEEFIASSNDREIDAETFLRAWRRWRKASDKWSD